MKENEDYINEATKECPPPTPGNMEMIPYDVVMVAMNKLREASVNYKNKSDMTEKEIRIKQILDDNPEITADNRNLAKVICLLDAGKELLEDKPVEVRLRIAIESAEPIN